MISQVNSAAIRSAYQNGETRTKKEESPATVSEQGDTSKIDVIKASIEKGEYQVDLEALAQKITDELM